MAQLVNLMNEKKVGDTIKMKKCGMPLVTKPNKLSIL